MKYIKRKTLLYKTGVEYGEYAINHVLGCSHGCKYPCYAYLQKKRFGLVKGYGDWCQPKIVENAVELLESELERKKDKVKKVQLCFATDPFMMGYPGIEERSLDLVETVNKYKIPCSILTKGVLSPWLSYIEERTGIKNDIGITLVSLSEEFREKWEPGAAPIVWRLTRLKRLAECGCKTWVSIEPYPTPNIIEQDINELLEAVGFVDKIVFGRLNYNKLVSQYKDSREFYNKTAKQVIKFCKKNHIQYHIKEGTINE